MVKLEGSNCILTVKNKRYCVSISDRGYLSQCVCHTDQDCTESDFLGVIGVGNTVVDSLNDLNHKIRIRSNKVCLTEGRSISDNSLVKVSKIDIEQIEEILGSIGIRVTTIGGGVEVNIDQETINITTKVGGFYEVSMVVSGKTRTGNDRTSDIERTLSGLSRRLWLSHLIIEKIINNSKCIEEISAEFPDEPLIP